MAIIKSGTITSPNIRNLSFDPLIPVINKAGNRKTDERYKDGLREAVFSTLQLACNVANANQENDKSQVWLWASKKDIQECLEKIRDEFQKLKTASKSDIKNYKLMLPENIHLSNIETHDYNGEIISGINRALFTFSYFTRDSKDVKNKANIFVIENKDIRAFSKHCLGHGYVNDKQYQTVEYLANKIDPDHDQYLQEIGLVVDIKKLIIVFLQQSAFKGGSYIMDIDRANALKEHNDDAYEKGLTFDLSSIDPYFRNFNRRQDNNIAYFAERTLENDTLFLTNNKTDKNEFFKLIQQYHDIIKKMDGIHEFFIPYSSTELVSKTTAKKTKDFVEKQYDAKNIFDTSRGLIKTDAIFTRVFRSLATEESYVRREKLPEEYFITKGQEVGRTWDLERPY